LLDFVGKDAKDWSIKMKQIKTVAMLALVAGFLAAPALAEEVDVGKQEFRNNCAACHGTSGKGDGPLAGMITQRVADLTQLAKKNDGVFPFDKVYEVIDGRTVPAHGTREMPVWGDRYSSASHDYYMDYRKPYDSEAFVRSRILMLVGHIHELQEK